MRLPIIMVRYSNAALLALAPGTVKGLAVQFQPTKATPLAGSIGASTVKPDPTSRKLVRPWRRCRATVADVSRCCCCKAFCFWHAIAVPRPRVVRKDRQSATFRS